MSRIDPYDGLGLPDPHWVDTTYLAPNTAAALTSDYSEAGSIPGRVTQVDGQTLVPVISGGQGDETVNLRVNRSGYVGAAGIVYDVDSDTRRGWLTPRACGYEVVNYDDTNGFASHPVSSVVIPSTQQIVTAYALNGSGSVYVRTRASDGTWSAAVEVTTASAQGLCLYVTPDERRLILARVGTAERLGTHYSDDGGATWSVLARVEDVGVTLPFAPSTMSGAFIGQDMILLDSNGRQYASADGGLSWVLVDDSGYDFPRVAVTPDAAVVAYADNSATELWALRLSSAFQPLTQARSAQIDTGSISNVLATADQDGTVYVKFGEVLYSSADSGETWDAGTTISAFNGSGTSSSATLIAARGSLWYVGTFGAGPSTTEATVWAFKLSAWSSVEWDGTIEATWVGLSAPDDNGWSLSGSAGSLSNGHLLFNLIGAAGSYTWDGASTSLTPALHFVARCTSAGSLTSSLVAASLLSCDGSDSYQMTIRFTSTGFRVHDNIGAADVATVTVDMTTDLEILMCFTAGGEGLVAYKRQTESVWTRVSAVESYAFVTLGAGAANWQAEFGHIASGTQTSRWKFAFAYDDVGDVMTGNSMLGKRITGLPYPLADVEDADGNVGFLSIRGGLGLNTETYAIPPAHTYALENALVAVAPGPRKGWRSTDTTEQIIAINLSGSEYAGGAFGIYFGRINFRTAYLERHNGSNWVTVGTLDAATGMADLEYDRQGGSIYPQMTATTSGRIIQDAEYEDGGWAHLTDGVDDYARYVCENTGGWWQDRDNTDAVIPVVNLDDVDDTEPASGEVTLVSSDAVLVVYPTTRIIAQRWRIRIPEQVCPDDYFTAGVILPFRLVPFAQPWAWGAAGERAAQYDSFRDAAGIESRSRRGDEVETWTLDWTDGVSMYAPRQETGGRHRVGTSSGLPLADEGTVLTQLRSFLRRTRGQTLPVVALSRLPTSDATLTDRTLFLYGYLTGSVSHSLAQGFENETELVRLDGIRVEGIPG